MPLVTQRPKPRFQDAGVKTRPFSAGDAWDTNILTVAFLLLVIAMASMRSELDHMTRADALTAT